MLRIIFALALVPSVAFADKTFSKGAGETWDCTKDPTVTIKTAKGTYGFHGECKRITITGGKNAVSIETVVKLSVSGSNNLVDVDQVTSIVVTGANNKVTWKKSGNGDKPTITSKNKSNKVEQAK